MLFFVRSAQGAAGPGLRSLQEIMQGFSALKPEVLERHHKILDTVEPERAEIVTQFAPCREKPHRTKIRERQGPDGALGFLADDICVVETHLGLAANGAPQRGQIER